MAEQLLTAAGAPVSLEDAEDDAAFARAMAAPSAGAETAPAPPDIPPADPGAPFGRKIDGTPKIRPGGRPPKQHPRTTSEKPADAPGKRAANDAPPAAAEALGEFLGGAALGLAVIPVPSEAVRVRMRLQAGVVRETGDGLARGLALTAQHSGPVRWAVEKVTAGGGAWVFPAAMAMMPFALQTAMLWRTDITEDMTAAADLIEGQVMAEFRAQMGAAAAPPAPPGEA
jgi:hypothetical protein